MRHTSPYDADVHPAAFTDERLLAECDSRRLRRGGPGGQHRNKVETAVVLVHRPSGVKAEANERRSQAENLSVAIFRLRVNLALEIHLRRPPQSRPSPLWQSRCGRSGRINVAADHADFPAMLAEALDAIACFEYDLKPAAEALGCSTTQLLKLVKKEPRALVLINSRRKQRGLHELR